MIGTKKRLFTDFWGIRACVAKDFVPADTSMAFRSPWTFGAQPSVLLIPQLSVKNKKSPLPKQRGWGSEINTHRSQTWS